jgi:[calcium/calmodulin-dependent protein kinase] kinase
MKKIDHPHIVKLHEVIDAPDDNKLYLVMEYMQKGAILSKNYWKYELE